MTRSVQCCPRFTGDACRRPIRNVEPTLPRSLSQHSPPIPYIENEQATHFQMAPDDSQRRQQISVSELITEYGEHHQHNIEAFSKIELANIALVKRDSADGFLCGGLGASLRQHRGGTIDSDD